jgi:carbonic anhydrase
VSDVSPAASEEDVSSTRLLFQEYAASLGFDLCFQNFDKELRTLPGPYAPPKGALFLARLDGVPAGCIGLRAFSEGIGELKRLYVVPRFRMRGLARKLVSSAIGAAERIGYSALVLDTVASMIPAIALYESFGFGRTEPYYANPLQDVVYFRKSL